MNFFEYTSFHFIWMDVVIWFIAGAVSFASLTKGSDHIKQTSGHWHWWIFRCLKVLFIFMSLLYMYQGMFNTVPILLLDLLMHTTIAAMLTWQFIYKRIIKKDWYGSNGQTAGDKRIPTGDSTKQSAENSHQTKLSEAKRVLSQLQGTPQEKPLV